MIVFALQGYTNISSLWSSSIIVIGELCLTLKLDENKHAQNLMKSFTKTFRSLSLDTDISNASLEALNNMAANVESAMLILSAMMDEFEKHNEPLYIAELTAFKVILNKMTTFPNAIVLLSVELKTRLENVGLRIIGQLQSTVVSSRFVTESEHAKMRATGTECLLKFPMYLIKGRNAKVQVIRLLNNNDVAFWEYLEKSADDEWKAIAQENWNILMKRKEPADRRNIKNTVENGRINLATFTFLIRDTLTTKDFAEVFILMLADPDPTVRFRALELITNKSELKTADKLWKMFEQHAQIISKYVRKCDMGTNKKEEASKKEAIELKDKITEDNRFGIRALQSAKKKTLDIKVKAAFTKVMTTSAFYVANARRSLHPPAAKQSNVQRTFKNIWMNARKKINLFKRYELTAAGRKSCIDLLKIILKKYPDVINNYIRYNEKLICKSPFDEVHIYDKKDYFDVIKLLAKDRITQLTVYKEIMKAKAMNTSDALREKTALGWKLLGFAKTTANNIEERNEALREDCLKEMDACSSMEIELRTTRSQEALHQKIAKTKAHAEMIFALIQANTFLHHALLQKITEIFTIKFKNGKHMFAVPILDACTDWISSNIPCSTVMHTAKECLFEIMSLKGDFENSVKKKTRALLTDLRSSYNDWNYKGASRHICLEVLVKVVGKDYIGMENAAVTLRDEAFTLLFECWELKNDFTLRETAIQTVMEILESLETPGNQYPEFQKKYVESKVLTKLVMKYLAKPALLPTALLEKILSFCCNF